MKLTDIYDDFVTKNTLTRQCRDILQWLDDFGSITPMEAMFELGIMRLAARIFDIRSKLGIEIGDEIVSDVNRRGEPVHYKKYKKVA